MITRPLERPKTPMTDQEIFTFVWGRFVVEKSPQCRDIYGCTYGDANGACGCAVGCMFTGEDAEAITIPISSIQVVAERYSEIINAYFADGSVPLLASMQRSHDMAFVHFEDQMRGIAKKYSLNIP